MPRDVLAFRAVQAARLGALQRFGGWQRIQDRADAWWTPSRVETALTTRPRGSLVAVDGQRTLAAAASARFLDGDALRIWGEQIEQRRFNVLGVPVPESGPWPWHADWRYGHVWAPTKRGALHDFYQPRVREHPFDVRFPWELGRLGFLIPAVQADAIGGTGGRGFATDVLVDWERSNPLAGSIGWHPMEASMRAINLCIVSQMVRVLGDECGTTAPLLRLLATHGEFIFRSREYTDVRGNHYAANVVALLLIGLELESHYPSAAAWIRFSAPAIEQELLGQILPDGVDFEKSSGYHRLVTGLLILAAHALRRAGLPLSDASIARLDKAVSYCEDLVRPDGGSPHVGDSDDAVVLPFDRGPVDDGRTLVATARALLDDTGPVLAERLPAAACWLVGAGAIDRYRIGSIAKTSVRHYYPDGGIVVVRDGESYLWVDVGEVGLAGRGGHGHNDLLSFELMLDSVPLVVDPGTYLYTGDQDARDELRGTAGHNSLALDGAEIAPLLSMWRIADVARPINTRVDLAGDGEAILVTAGHTGYRRLSEPATHHRRFEFDPRLGRMVCHDEITSNADHRVERFLHLGPDVEALTEPGRATLQFGARRWSLTFDQASTLSCRNGWVSRSFGSRRRTTVLILESMSARDPKSWFCIESVR